MPPSAETDCLSRGRCPYDLLPLYEDHAWDEGSVSHFFYCSRGHHYAAAWDDVTGWVPVWEEERA